ncbi:ParB/RepB/Spo0J family partition protein [Noviherbaspirillum aerium]|uniref:ParB/RepB/Spo0J family partition protein n=1 Tax=Noviherbaspirillum aerium TaxID=2588497 RepID=UPI00178C65D1|nr:ParB/RepB/Spo0J family partition protein [Noviherbaspirillum aerium]
MGLADRMKKTTAGLSDAVEKRMNSDTEATRKPVTMPGQLGAFRLEAQRYADRIEELEAKLSNLPYSKLKLSDLHELEGRRRKLSNEQFHELVENLRNNDLMTPITVRPRETGGFEIISGHNRVAAYQQLGRDEIEAVIRTMDDDKALMGAFYANLLQPQLPDFEKFLGFMAVRALNPSLTVDQLAEQAGISSSHVRRLMSYEDLPEAAIRILEASPGCLGSSAASELAKFSKAGKSDAVIEVIKGLSEGKLTQEESVRIVAQTQATQAPKTAERPKPISIKRGKEKFMTIRPTASPTVFRLDFEDAGDATTVMAEFQDWLKQHFLK